ncbi:F-type H+-transporting ATPase subunit delta [Amorphus orientalis]|uniref:ATP synthase subunit delta n=1 Tax=Amorphus orientalis TaxID=649198 RepID=A0AAE3VL28_9HYPH|nr:F0F1 ATP synthase subunit delta [Amorphus orientalis]MDQ0313878.1 F-type H+-transporting ATPase subunit delta [Amorphus orientalis]
MTDAQSFTSGVALRYASALFELAKDENALDAVESDVEAFGKMLDESEDLRRLAVSPLYSKSDQVEALDAIFAKAETGKLTANFFKVVAENRRLFAARDIVRAFQSLMSAHRGEMLAEVTSAEPLSEDNETRLREILAGETGRAIKLSTKVDPSLIGGLVVKVGSRMIDTSLRTRLNSLKTAMKEVG